MSRSDSPVEPEAEELIMYGRPAGLRPLDWSWVTGQLTAAGAYWAVAPTAGHPHPRPLWGVWSHDRLHLSVGSPRLAADLGPGAAVTVHLASITDVVIVEATITGPTAAPDLVEAYNAKYDWDYSVGEYGPLTIAAPSTVLAWRSAGRAGRGGFREAGRWRFPPEPSPAR